MRDIAANIYLYPQTLQQEEMTGAAFHPLDDNLMITHGKGHLTFWTRRKDGFFERTDIIKPVNYERVDLDFVNQTLMIYTNSILTFVQLCTNFSSRGLELGI